MAAIHDDYCLICGCGFVDCDSSGDIVDKPCYIWLSDCICITPDNDVHLTNRISNGTAKTKTRQFYTYPLQWKYNRYTPCDAELQVECLYFYKMTKIWPLPIHPHDHAIGCHRSCYNLLLVELNYQLTFTDVKIF